LTSVSERIGIGMLGYAFMGRVHSHALGMLRNACWPIPLEPELVSICGRNQKALAETRNRYGWSDALIDWRQQVADPRIGVYDNCGPNVLHSEPSMEAARHGKHVLCEKPLGVSAEDALETWRVVEQAGVVHMCAFNYRFMPAIRLAHQLIEAGEIGDLHHFRSRFLLSSAVEPHGSETQWRLQRKSAGSGAVADIGSHHIDLARYLVGEPRTVSAIVKTFFPERAGVVVDVDDAFHAIVEFDNGATGILEGSRVAGGRTVESTIEIDGSRGSLTFDMQSLNQLRLSHGGGFTHIPVTDPAQPFMHHWWPKGHPIGWAESFTHEIDHFLRAVAGESGVAPEGATFEDGYRCAEVCDAILRSATSGRREPVRYRTLEAEEKPPTASFDPVA
jgi:predicted dehydrogenase